MAKFSFSGAVNRAKDIATSASNTVNSTLSSALSTLASIVSLTEIVKFPADAVKGCIERLQTFCNSHNFDIKSADLSNFDEEFFREFGDELVRCVSDLVTAKIETKEDDTDVQNDSDS